MDGNGVRVCSMHARETKEAGPIAPEARERGAGGKRSAATGPRVWMKFDEPRQGLQRALPRNRVDKGHAPNVSRESNRSCTTAI